MILSLSPGQWQWLTASDQLGIIGYPLFSAAHYVYLYSVYSCQLMHTFWAHLKLFESLRWWVRCTKCIELRFPVKINLLGIEGYLSSWDHSLSIWRTHVLSTVPSLGDLQLLVIPVPHSFVWLPWALGCTWHT